MKKLHCRCAYIYIIRHSALRPRALCLFATSSSAPPFCMCLSDFCTHFGFSSSNVGSLCFFFAAQTTIRACECVCNVGRWSRTRHNNMNLCIRANAHAVSLDSHYYAPSVNRDAFLLFPFVLLLLFDFDCCCCCWHSFFAAVAGSRSSIPAKRRSHHLQPCCKNIILCWLVDRRATCSRRAQFEYAR